MTRAERKRIEETRRQALTVLEHLERACQFARIAVGCEEPEHAAEYLLGTIADLRPKLLPELRRAFEASRAIP
jgi:hypothetical protein